MFIRSGHFERRNSVINGSFHCSIKMLLFMKRQTQRVLFFFLMVLKTQFDKCVPSGSTVYHIFLFLSQNKLHKQDDFRIPTVFFPSYQNKYSLIRAGSRRLMQRQQSDGATCLSHCHFPSPAPLSVPITTKVKIFDCNETHTADITSNYILSRCVLFHHITPKSTVV